MKKFKNLREAATDHKVPKKDDEKNMSKNDVEFADLHTVETDDHPVATDAQHPKKGKKKFSGVRKVKANEEVDLEEATGKEIAAKMMKDKSMKAFASKVAKMKTVTRDNLEKMLPDYVAGAAITKLFEEVEELDEKKTVNKIKAGTLNMRNGDQVKVSAKDAADLNNLLKNLTGDNNRERFDAEVKNSEGQYKSILKFARSVRNK